STPPPPPTQGPPTSPVQSPPANVVAPGNVYGGPPKGAVGTIGLVTPHGRKEVALQPNSTFSVVGGVEWGPTRSDLPKAKVIVYYYDRDYSYPTIVTSVDVTIDRQKSTILNTWSGTPYLSDWGTYTATIDLKGKEVPVRKLMGGKGVVLVETKFYGAQGVSGA